MNTPRAAWWPLWLAAVLVTGCESARASRIRKNSELYGSLDPFSRKLVRDGLFDVGFSADTVTMSLGKPDRVEERETSHGTVQVWVYKNFLYASMRNTGVGAREPLRPNRPAPVRAGSTALPNNPQGLPDPTIAEMGGPPLATLFLEMRDGRVVAAHIEL
jgi:hypothetical protein